MVFKMAETAVNEGRNLSEIFDEGLRIHDQLLNSNEPTNSQSYQDKVIQSINLLEEATRMVSMLGVFSTNETVDEIPTSDLKFFLLPFLLGNLQLKRTLEERLALLKVAEIYYVDFLQRCKDYEITDIDIPQISSYNESTDTRTQTVPGPVDNKDFMVMAKKREAKIKCYKEQKEIEKQLAKLKLVLENPVVDDEVKQRYFLALIKSSINKAVEELDSLKLEYPILNHIAKMKQQVANSECVNKSTDEARFSSAPKKPLNLVIITKDKVQKKVFGLGYPSLPVMSIEEFYDQKVKEGWFPESGPKSMHVMAMSENRMAETEKEEAEKERQVEEDEPETLRKAREWDDWKDDHRRGWGNRKNMG